jgi:hypothetical protein
MAHLIERLLDRIVFLLCRLTSGAFTIDSSTPTLRRNLNEHPIFIFGFFNVANLKFWDANQRIVGRNLG